MNKLRLTFSFYLFGIIALFLYSFTQVDLNLTLSKASVFQVLEKQFQFVGFYQRPISATIFTLISIILFICYLSMLVFAKKGIIKIKQISTITILTFIILAFSYNAFSYDLFNYIFDAKIVTFYHQIPYFHKATDFTLDPMLNFMRWTQRYYPYGPSWLILTVPLSFLGFGIFLPTFFLFKILMGLSFLGTCFLIYKISQQIFPENAVLNTVFFAFNPLVLIETLVSAHNDIPMIFFFLLSIYLFLQKKSVLSFISYLFSVGIKFSTGVLLPLYFVLEFFKYKDRRINWEKFFIISVLLSLITVLLATTRTNFQPWYFIFPLSMAAFVANKYYILIPSFMLSIFSVIIYVIYVLMTDYAKGYPLTIFNVEVLGLILTIMTPLVYKLVFKKYFKNMI